MTKGLYAMILGCALSASAWADSKEDLARELISLMQMGAQFEQTQVQMQNLYANLAPAVDVSDEERAITENFQSRMWEVIQEEMGWPKLEAHLLELYVTYFSEAELIDMIEFHRSPTGQRMIETMPMIREESMLFGQEAMLRLMPQIEALIQGLNSELEQYRTRSAESEERRELP